jgi:hypothetical protein
LFILIPLTSYLISHYVVHLIALLSILCFIPQILTNLMEICMLNILNLQQTSEGRK